MSTQIQIAPASGITVGTTAVTSGTIGRVFFQGTGDVVQQDSDLFWDNTNKRLGVGKTPAASSAKMVVAIADGTANQNYYLTLRNLAAGFGSWGFVKSGSNDLGINYQTDSDTPLGGTSLRFYYGGTSAFASSLSVGTLTTPSARLDVRAQGALSTDIAFRVRNSANTADIINVKGNGDAFIGLDAGRVNTGANNSFFGIFAGYSNTSGAQNSFFGQSCGLNNTTGGNNSFFGLQSGNNNTTGAQNSFFGQNAGYSNTTAANNSFFGQYAGFNNTTGANNSFFGVDAARYISNGSTSNSISNNSVFLGMNTKALANNQTNQIVIGYDAIGAGSNTATIGNTSIVKTILRGTLNAANLPTSPTGLVTGDIWNNLGILTIV